MEQHILLGLETIQQQQQTHSHLLEVIVNKLGCTEECLDPPPGIELPLESIEEIEMLENKLQDRTMEIKLVSIQVSFGLNIFI